ncbi:hypothetical protein DPV78_006629 [Talaromyces pinophilus]|nr:hypothetical protein DPV78_006629 [Talaromyces pinophilus]
MRPSSEYDFSWVILTFYAGPEHEVEPVLSGYKIALVYNLIHGPTAALLKARPDNLERLHSLLDSWVRAVERSLEGAESWASEEAKRTNSKRTARRHSSICSNTSIQRKSSALLDSMAWTKVLISSKLTHEGNEDYEDEEDYHDPESIDHPVYGKYNLEYYRRTGCYSIVEESADRSIMEDISHQYLFPLATRLFELIAQFKRSATAEERNFLLFGEFPLSEKRRDHPEQQLNSREFSTSTIKVGLPYILRVEKTYARLESYHKVWLERRRIAKSVMDDLAQKCPPLKEILGEANYRSFYEHANLRIVTFETGPPNPNSDPRLYIQITVPPRYRGSSSQSSPKEQYSNYNKKQHGAETECLIRSARNGVPCLGKDRFFSRTRQRHESSEIMDKHPPPSEFKGLNREESRNLQSEE